MGHRDYDGDRISRDSAGFSPRRREPPSPSTSSTTSTFNGLDSALFPQDPHDDGKPFRQLAGHFEAHISIVKQRNPSINDGTPIGDAVTSRTPVGRGVGSDTGVSDVAKKSLVLSRGTASGRATAPSLACADTDTSRGKGDEKHCTPRRLGQDRLLRMARQC